MLLHQRSVSGKKATPARGWQHTRARNAKKNIWEARGERGGAGGGVVYLLERAGWPDDLVELLWWCYEAELDPEVAVACRRSSDELVEACGGDGGPSPPFHA